MTDDPFTMAFRLCDDRGIISDTPVEPGAPGTAFDPGLTYRKLHDNLRARNRNPDTRKPYEGPDYTCTGSAHLGGEHIRCTSPAHLREVVEGEATVGPGQAEEWRCPHGVVFYGSPDFISGARLAHSEIENRELARAHRDTPTGPPRPITPSPGQVQT